jgi:hypothetical protein
LDRWELALLEIYLQIRLPTLVEIEELGDQAPKALLEGASPSEDLRGVLQRRGPANGEDQLPASRHQLI